MRELDFIVNGQTLMKDPLCDFTGLVAGTKGYLKLYFEFSPAWKNYKKAVRVKADSTVSYIPIENGYANLDDFSAAHTRLTISVKGVDGDKVLTTDSVVISQKKGED